jgi:DNA-binding NarL/FixJ family response regulator
MKRDEALNDIPMIIVSTRATEKDIMQGMHLGVSLYIMKGKFSEKNCYRLLRPTLRSEEHPSVLWTVRVFLTLLH